MKSNPVPDPKPDTKPNLRGFIRKCIFFYITFAAVLLIFCFILGWRTLDSIGTGLIYGALCLLLFGTLTLFGNTIPAQLSKLSLPKYRPPSIAIHENAEIDKPAVTNQGKELFLTSLVCSTLLFATGVLFRIL